MTGYRKRLICIAGFLFIFPLTFLTSVWAGEKNSGRSPVQIAVIPFQSFGLNGKSGDAMVCPLCGAGASIGVVSPGAEKVVEEIFINKLKTLRNVEIVPSERTESVYKRVSSESLKESLLNTLVRVGQELKADLLVVGYVYRYSERVGYKFSSERPASVAYEIHLLDSESGNIIWRGFFDKTQKSLMEDVLQISSFFKGGGKWLTARQLAEQGMDDIFKKFPRFEH